MAAKYPARSRRRQRPFTPTLLVLVIVALVLAWAAMTDLGRRPFDPTHLSLPFGREIYLRRDSSQILQNGPATELTTAITQLRVREHEDSPRYSRDAFGQRWADEDRNGCDTRNDILGRDLTEITYRDRTHKCVVATGVFVDPYTGENIHFRRGRHTSEDVQIDHVVALADAWHSGAWQWDEPTRQRFANDPLNLLAVSGPANQDKSAQTAATWLPENTGFHCAYIARQVAVKNAWGLSVTEAERHQMAQVAQSCPHEPLPQNN